MEQLRVRVEAMRQRQQGNRNVDWAVRWRERELQRLQERVAGQEEMDRREMEQEEQGARFLARDVGRE